MEADGYINTYWGAYSDRKRYTDLQMGHELYCMGHLIQAGVARLRTHGPDPLTELARRAADHVCRRFGPDCAPPSTGIRRSRSRWSSCTGRPVSSDTCGPLRQ